MKNHRIHNPGFLELDDAYRGLARHGELNLSVDPFELEQTLSNLERIGFIAMEITLITGAHTVCEVSAYKGKHGPCYDTGRKAVYRGAALAVLDDDHHLLISGEEKPVCEKTANLYHLPPYRNLISGSEGKPALLTQLRDQPAPFHCDQLEEDPEKLYAMLQTQKKEGERILLFYPGPFRLLVLRDGTLVRRGRVNRVPVSEAKLLMRKDRLAKWEGPPPADVHFFQDRYEEAGPQCLLDEMGGAALVEEVRETDLSKLSKISSSFKGRLSGMIEKNKKYLILSGSDPANPFGCCPSEEVAQANLLVRAGILSNWPQENPADGCPVNIYAFKGELQPLAGEMRFDIDEAFRSTVKTSLETRFGPTTAMKIARWILLLFVAVSLLFAFFRMKDTSRQINPQSWFEQLNPAHEDQVMLLLFHYHKRCLQCRNMENYTHAVLEEHFREAVNKGLLRFRLINMDQDQNRDFSRQLGLFSATLLLVRFDRSGTPETHVIKEAWTLYDEENNFKKMMKQELDRFLRHHDE